MYDLYIKILFLLLVTSCLKEQDLEIKIHYLRLYQSSNTQLQLIQDVSISIYRVKVINLDLNILEATRYFKAAAADKKIDIKLKSPGPKDIIIEALDDKSKIVYTANIAFEQGGGYSYVKWPDVFSEFKNQKSKNYSLIFKLTDDLARAF